MTTSSIRFTFITSNSLLSRVIRWMTRETITHVIIDDLQLCGRDVVLEAVGKGVTISDRARTLEGCEVVDIIDVPTGAAFKSTVIYNVIRDNLGAGYDYTGMLGYLWVMLGRALKQRWHNPLGNAKSYVCVELAVDILRRIDPVRASLIDPLAITPQEFRDFLEAHYVA